MPDLIKVAKFGGTSMADLTAMKRCASIVSSDPDKKVIVVSATSGTTNLLTELCTEESVETRVEIVSQIKEKHLAICKQFGNPKTLLDEVTALLSELEAIASRKQIMTKMLRDEILSFGERLSSRIFSEVLKVDSGDDIQWLDARTVIKTDNHYGSAEPDIDEIGKASSEILQPLLKDARVVTQGFIGSDSKGTTTTLGRGGSDYSAALFAEAVDADVLEIWTDVTAIYTTDPRIAPDARPITEISFDEAAELSVFGAKVLHPATVVPAIRKNIRVYVGSSIHPEKPGTWIVRDTKEKPVIRAISLRRRQTLVKVHSLDMLHRYGFLAKLFQVLGDHKISVDLVTTSEVSVALTLDSDINNPGQPMLGEEVLEELQKFSEVEIIKDLSLVALVGNNLNQTAGLSGPIFGSLLDVNIHLICHGASSYNLCFLVAEEDAENVVQVLHKQFIK
ncbi:lysine-sensitive aspartokinase 3 [Rhodohalobacter sp. 614A]|uniref:lysine-sensitive aspartokinase 3 n=1 Tax=Rhodohalobacter sp. 614A TaxID=2908649 RepID=UPI001F177082|nr:lysine-sensitive aspartokinase 3 [Rhodohalobacter sp. 614A]